MRAARRQRTVVIEGDGTPTKITREDGSATYYQYDRIYQLTGETQVDDQGQVEYAFEYQYDKAHNRTVKVDNGTPTYYSYNAANELLTETTDGQTTYYHYDRCGNTVAKQEASGTTYYDYDTENLMTRIDFADGGHNYFAYEADSKRVSKQDSEGFTEFIYQGPDMLKLLLERDEAGETQAHYTMGDGLEAMRRANGDGIAAGPSSFYHYNHLGTTHELTDGNEDVTDTYRHDAWGMPLAHTGSTVNPHTYVGKQRYYSMPEARLYHLGFRDYAGATGRFLTLDPARWLARAARRHDLRSLRSDPVVLRRFQRFEGLARVMSRSSAMAFPRVGHAAISHRHAYAANSPVRCTDAYGLEACTLIIVIICGIAIVIGIGGCGPEPPPVDENGEEDERRPWDGLPNVDENNLPFDCELLVSKPSHFQCELCCSALAEIIDWNHQVLAACNEACDEIFLTAD